MAMKIERLVRVTNGGTHHSAKTWLAILDGPYSDVWPVGMRVECKHGQDYGSPGVVVGYTASGKVSVALDTYPWHTTKDPHMLRKRA